MTAPRLSGRARAVLRHLEWHGGRLPYTALADEWVRRNHDPKVLDDPLAELFFHGLVRYPAPGIVELAEGVRR